MNLRRLWLWSHASRRWVLGLTLAAMLSVGCAVASEDAAAPAPSTASVPTALPAPPVEPVSPVEPVPPALSVPTAEPFIAFTPTPVPTPPVPTPLVPATPPPDDGCAVGVRAELDPNRPQYQIDLDVDLGAGTVLGEQRIRFTPDLATNELVLRLWPNGPRPAQAGNSLDISYLSVGGNEVVVVQESPTLARVPLGRLVAPGETIRIDMEFVFTIGSPNRGRMAATGEWARFGSFYPMLPWEPGRGWAAESPTSGFAEAVSSPAADFSVRVDGVDDLEVLAVGSQNESGRWISAGARDFAVSIGSFEIVEAIALAPEPVWVRVGRHSSIPDDPQVYLDRIVASLELFAERWGPYPWPELSVALTPELRGGIEFPGHILQGPGSSGRTTPHEVAHQWFYALVGNNQGLHPWLDEGLASYAEFVFEQVDPAGLAVPAGVTDRSGESMAFWETRLGDYYPAVYVNPAKALYTASDPDTIDCVLRRYVAANAFKIATPADFFAAADGVIADVDAAFAPYGLTRD